MTTTYTLRIAKSYHAFLTLREKCPYSQFFWSVFSRVWTAYGEIRSISPYSVRMRENTDQKNSEYGHFTCSACYQHYHGEMTMHFYIYQHFMFQNLWDAEIMFFFLVLFPQPCSCFFHD